MFTIIKLGNLRHNHFEKIILYWFKADAATICLLLLLPLCENLFLSRWLLLNMYLFFFLYKTILKCYVCRRWPGRASSVAITRKRIRLLNVRPRWILLCCFAFFPVLALSFYFEGTANWLSECYVSCRSGGIRTGFMEAKLHQNKTNIYRMYTKQKIRIGTSSTVVFFFFLCF